MSDEELWKYASALDSTLHVGLKRPGQGRGVSLQGRRLVPESEVPGMEATLVKGGVEVIRRDDLHPLLTVRVQDVSDVRRLRRSPFADFVEPASFPGGGVALFDKCGSAPVYTQGPLTAEGDRIPYSAAWHHVNSAWLRTAGAGITVGVVDTGTSASHSQLQSQWAAGLSAGRTIQYDWSDANPDTPSTPWNDTCGHGSKILGLIGAPRDGSNVVGFAYQANAHAVRALDDPVALFGIWDEVREGIQRAADASEIINMSFGSPWSNTSVANTIRYYHDGGSDELPRLFIAAVGSGGDSQTSVFPAGMPEVTATTGINPITSNHPNYYPCSTCFRGDDVEFSSWVDPETTFLANNSTAGVGSSSGSAAAITGIAALVWSEYPTWTRDQVLARMRAASPLTSKQNGSGYGPPNALCAVGGLCKLRVDGPAVVTQGTTASYTANYTVLEEDGPNRVSYSWDHAGPSKTVSFTPTACPGEIDQVRVRVTDNQDGYTASATKDVLVQDDGDPTNDGLCHSSGS